MPFRFASEQLASFRRDAQRLVDQAGDQEDTQQVVETLARRIQGSGLRAQLPFVMTSAGELLVGAQGAGPPEVTFT